MALANRKSQDIFNKRTGGDRNAKTIDTSKETEIKNKFDNGEHILDQGMFENLAPALYAVQQVAEDIEELRRFVSSEITSITTSQSNAITANTAKRDAQYIFIPVICNFYGDINTESYVPFSDGETESTASSNRRNQFIAPFDGQFHKAIFRSNQSLLERGAGVTLTVKSKRATNNSSRVNDLETETVTTTAAENFMEVTFSSASAFSKGDRLLMSMDLPGVPRGNKNWFVTVIFKIDQTT
tara:strand:+ start:105 stop:827 length:723 start_codon:yes stop_codon:yes gene_type:complete